MSEELEKLQRLLERATAAEDAPQNEPDPEAASLREAWIAFGRLLEAAQPPAETSLGSRPVPPKRSYRRSWPSAGLLAASLLICAGAMWMLQATHRFENAVPLPTQTASTGVTPSATPSPPAPLPHAGEGSFDRAKPAASATRPSGTIHSTSRWHNLDGK